MKILQYCSVLTQTHNFLPEQPLISADLLHLQKPPQSSEFTGGGYVHFLDNVFITFNHMCAVE